MLIDTSIIPQKHTYYDSDTRKIIDWKFSSNNKLDKKSIATFCALGFMLDDDTYYNDIKVFKPSTDYQINEDNQIMSQQKN